MLQDHRYHRMPDPRPRETAYHGYGDWREHQLRDEVRARRWPALLGWGAAAVFSVWVIAASAYLLLHDDMMREAADQRARLQEIYEDRITRMRTEVDTINGRLMLNQDAFEQKLNRLRARQVLLERRQTALSELLGDARTASLMAAERAIAGISDGTIRQGADGDTRDRRADAEPSARRGHEIRLTFAPRGAGSRMTTMLADAGPPSESGNSIDQSLARLARSQEILEADQARSLNLLEARTSGAAKLIADQLTALGLRPELAPVQVAGLEVAPVRAGLGGPFVPVLLNGRQPPPFEQQLRRIRAHIGHADRLYGQLLRLPVLSPLAGEAAIVSGFGERMDPFLRTPAMHSGVDFRASHGSTVQAAAPGRVVRAGRQGGYGRTVEILHSNGYSTRYAHLSAIFVKEGDSVKAGAPVGRVGSTGRSTGPHLHYEVRSGEEPVDPARFLRLAKLFGL